MATDKKNNHSALLKLMALMAPGEKLSIQPEHLEAFEAAVEAIAFKMKVGELLEPSGARLASSAVPYRDRQSNARPASGAQAQHNRPLEGRGAIWTPEEESRLLGQWNRGDTVGAIAESHKRSPKACYSRLERLGAEGLDPELKAMAEFLLSRQQPISKSNAELIESMAKDLGFDPQKVQEQAPRRNHRMPR